MKSRLDNYTPPPVFFPPLSQAGPLHHPVNWPGVEQQRPAPASYGKLSQLFTSRTLATLGQFVQCRDITPEAPAVPQTGFRPFYRPLSPTRISIAPLDLYARFPSVRTPRVSLQPKTIPVTSEQARVLQLMQLVISAARAVMPNAANQVGGLYASDFMSDISINEIRTLTDRQIGSILKRVDPKSLDGDKTRSEDLARLMGAASHGTGNCGELNAFCYYLLGSLAEMAPHQMALLYSAEANHQLLAARVGDKVLVCDAWPQFPMAAPASELIPSFRKAFFPDTGEPQYGVLAIKEQRERLTAFPAVDIVKASRDASGRAYTRNLVHSAFSGLDSFVGYKTNQIADYLEAERAAKSDIYSVLYSSPPGIQYQVDGQRPFNTRYLYPPSKSVG